MSLAVTDTKTARKNLSGIGIERQLITFKNKFKT